MAYEVGGRADKYGNRFELNWVIKKLLDIIEEKITSVTIEALGDDEFGVDLWVVDKDGNREAQQCKARNGSKENWDYYSAESRHIWEKWKFQLERDDYSRVALVSPLNFTLLEDVIRRSRTCNYNSKDFYYIQIEKSGNDTRCLFSNICKAMNIDISTDEGKDCALSYFTRMNIRQFPDSELRDMNLERIKRLFINEPKTVYALLLDYILNEDIYGQNIDFLEIDSFINQNKIEYRNLIHDERIWPAIREINEEYDLSFRPFSCGFIKRDVSEKCFQLISQGKSLILHGNAGNGKSGCTENIIERLKNSNIPYIAIKLDRHIPSYNSETWSKTLGLPASISYCIDAISKDKAVIILDQLDALRWTQAHSGDALTICVQIIKEIQNINKERKQAISLVFVCRTYDLENDKSISNIFTDEITWEKIKVDLLKPAEIEHVIGSQYRSLSIRTRKLLSVSSNLYIWEKLDKSQSYDNICATHQLIKEWWRQISNCLLKHLRSEILETIKWNIVSFCYNNSRVNAPIVVVDIPADYEDYLVSSGFIVVEKGLVAFVHQSILDCFFAEEMIRRFYEKEDIITIIGRKVLQTPSRRYQTQIFLQQLSELSIADFLRVGKEMLDNTEIRYSFKYVFIEVLSYIEPDSKDVSEFVFSLLKDQNWKKSVILTVVRGSSFYVHLLRKQGVLDSWIVEPQTKKVVIDLMLSIRNELVADDVLFIRKHIFVDSDIEMWSSIFCYDYQQDTEEFFELRLEVYEKYANIINYDITIFYINNNIIQCGIRTIRLLSLMLKDSSYRKERLLQRHSEEFDNNIHLDVDNYQMVLELLLECLPDINVDTRYSNWCARHSSDNCLERICVRIIKLATERIAIENPTCFFDLYQFAFEKGNYLYNEIILDGMLHLDDLYADYILNYISRNEFVNAIEDTSNNGNKLYFAKKLIRHYSECCSDVAIRKFEDNLLCYKEPHAVESLRFRINENKKRMECGESLVYFPFWGDLQYELIPAICDKRRSKRANDTLMVLTRRNTEHTGKYNYSAEGCLFTVVSPISGKKLTVKNWVKIITSSNIKLHGKTQWNHKNGICIESSLSEFVSAFIQYVADSPKDITEVLNSDYTIIPHDSFIDALFCGLSTTKHIDLIDEKEFVNLIKRFGYDYQSSRAKYIAITIEKINASEYRDYFVSVLWDIICNHYDPIYGKPTVVSSDDEEILKVESVELNAINSVRGIAIKALSQFIIEDRVLFDNNKNKISEIAKDSNPVIRYASLYVMWAAYVHDKKWSSELMLSVFESDNRMIGFCHSRRFICYSFEFDPNRIIKLVKNAFSSDDERLYQMAGYAIVELYMIKDVFENVYDLYLSAEKNKRKHMLEMIILYFGVEKYREKAKELLERIILIEADVDNEILWGSLFREKIINLNEDTKLINLILKSKIKRPVLSYFSGYIMEKRRIVDYSNVILDIGQSILENPNEMYYNYGVETELIKLIVCLYAEVENSESEDNRVIANRCLDIWDEMYEKNIGAARELSEKLVEI